MTLPRLCPDRPFPSYRFTPKKNPHPLKEGGHSFGEEEPVASPMDASRPYENEFFLYALDLFNHGYYWESHVYLEALWNAHERKGDLAHLFLGLIKLAAAGVKWRLGHDSPTLGHLKRAKEHFENLSTYEVAGLNKQELIELVDSIKMPLLNGEIVYSFTITPQSD